MALNFYDVLGGRVKAEQARSIAQDTEAKKISNAQSYMDLQQKIRALPILKNQTKTLEIESDVALKRAESKLGLLNNRPEIIAQQEAMKLDAETDDLKRQKYTGSLAAAAQWQGPVTSSSIEQYKKHLEDMGTSFEELGYKDDMTPAEVGILQQAQTGMYTATQAQLQKKDLMDIEQQNALTRDERNIFNKLKANAVLQEDKYYHERQMLMDRLAWEMEIAGKTAQGKLKLDDMFRYNTVDDAAKVTVDEMRYMFPASPMFEDYGPGDEEATEKANSYARKVVGVANRLVENYWDQGKQLRQTDALKLAADQLVPLTDAEGNVHPANSKKLAEERQAWISQVSPQIQQTPEFQQVVQRATQNPAWREMNEIQQQQAIEEYVQKIGEEWWADPVARGWTNAGYERSTNAGTGREVVVPSMSAREAQTRNRPIGQGF